MIHHMVLIKLKDDVDHNAVQGLFDRFKGMVSTFDGLEAFSGGPYSSPEGINRGFNYGFSMDFRDAESRDRYLPSEEHIQIAQDLGPMLAGDSESSVCAFDYEY